MKILRHRADVARLAVRCIRPAGDWHGQHFAQHAARIDRGNRRFHRTIAANIDRRGVQVAHRGSSGGRVAQRHLHRAVKTVQIGRLPTK